MAAVTQNRARMRPLGPMDMQFQSLIGQRDLVDWCGTRAQSREKMN